MSRSHQHQCAVSERGGRGREREREGGRTKGIEGRKGLRFRDAPGSSESRVSCSHPNTSVRVGERKGKRKHSG